MKLPRSIFVGPLALLTIGTAMAQPLAVTAPGPRPIEGAVESLTPDDAAERLIQLCVVHALGSEDMTYAWRRVFPGRTLHESPVRLNDGSLWGGPHIDIKPTGGLFADFLPHGMCTIKSQPFGGLEAPIEAAIVSQLAKSKDFVLRPLGTNLYFGVWTRPDRDLFANIDDFSVRISPGPTKPAK